MQRDTRVVPYTDQRGKRISTGQKPILPRQQLAKRQQQRWNEDITRGIVESQHMTGGYTQEYDDDDDGYEVEHDVPTQKMYRTMPQQTVTVRTIERRGIGFWGWLRILLLLSFLTAALYSFALLSQWITDTQHHIQCGTPYACQYLEAVGHKDAQNIADSKSTPSHFLVVYTNQRVSIIEMVRDEDSSVHVYSGPIIGNMKNVYATLTFQKNDQGFLDMVLHVDGQDFTYHNTGEKFLTLGN